MALIGAATCTGNEERLVCVGMWGHAWHFKLAIVLQPSGDLLHSEHASTVFPPSDDSLGVSQSAWPGVLLTGPSNVISK